MLEHKPPRNERDPEELMVGVCQTCKAPVECRRQDTASNRSAAWGHSDVRDAPTIGCPRCGAVVYLDVKRLPPELIIYEQ